MGRQAKFGFFSVLAIVLLRLAVGWHFFSEGSEKIEYDPEKGEYRITFSAEPFLRGAKGPLAETMQEFVPSGHKWKQLLAKAKEDSDSASKENYDSRVDWVYERNQAAKSKNPPVVETPDFAPHFEWEQEILSTWKAAVGDLKQFASFTEEQNKKAEAIFLQRQRQLRDYLASEYDDLVEYQHNLWKLGQHQEDSKAGNVPFHDAKIAQLQAQTSGTPRRWVAQVQDLEKNFKEELRGILTPEQRKQAVQTEWVSAAFADPAEYRLEKVNRAVTFLTIAVGICLLLGFFTRLASLAGLGFLISVMASQPPWVTGAILEFFPYQLVECAALFVLFVVGAGRWLGLDFFTYAIWNWFAGGKQEGE